MFACPIDGCPWQHTAEPITIPETATPDDTQALIAAGQARTNAIETAMTTHFNEHTGVDWANQVARLRQALIERPPLLCLGCFVDRHNAGRAGRPIPPQGLAQLIVNGNGQCLGHIAISDTPAMPGRTPGGIILGNGNVPPQMGG